MAGILDKYLEEYGITRYQLAKKSGIGQATWFHANNKPIERWKVKQVQALAKSTGVTASEALQKLEEIN